MDRPREFFIGNKRFCLWSPSLGMSIMLGRHISALGIDDDMLARNPSIEALRLVKDKRDELCYILAIHSYRTFYELGNSRTLQRRAKIFSSNLTDEEIARFFLVILGEPTPETIMSLTGITEDRKEVARISEYKSNDSHTKTFGGKTEFGALLDAACAKYGWTKDYVVWGIDLLSLRLMLADSINTIYLSEEDMKSLNIAANSEDEIGMTKEDFDKLKAFTSQEYNSTFSRTKRQHKPSMAVI